MELQGDQLAIAGRQRREGISHDRPAQRDIGLVIEVRLELLGRIGHQGRDPASATQLVERRVPSNPEQPGPLLTAPPIERPPPPVRALERDRGDILGRAALTQEREGVRVDVVPA